MMFIQVFGFDESIASRFHYFDWPCDNNNALYAVTSDGEVLHVDIRSGYVVESQQEINSLFQKEFCSQSLQKKQALLLSIVVWDILVLNVLIWNTSFLPNISFPLDPQQFLDVANIQFIFPNIIIRNSRSLEKMVFPLLALSDCFRITLKLLNWSFETSTNLVRLFKKHSGIS